jgi:probable rRNA maturation factor
MRMNRMLWGRMIESADRARRSKAHAKTEDLRLTIQCPVRGNTPPRASIRKWILAALETSAEITVRFVDRAEARHLNRDYRGRDYAANVLSFLYDSGPPLLGDIVLCLPVLAEEARAAGIGSDARIAHLLVHAVLHLRGFDHETEEEAEAMEARETEILARLGFADPYSSHSSTASSFSFSESSAAGEIT